MNFRVGEELHFGLFEKTKVGLHWWFWMLNCQFQFFLFWNRLIFWIDFEIKVLKILWKSCWWLFLNELDLAWLDLLLDYVLLLRWRATVDSLLSSWAQTDIIIRLIFLLFLLCFLNLALIGEDELLLVLDSTVLAIAPHPLNAIEPLHLLVEHVLGVTRYAVLVRVGFRLDYLLIVRGWIDWLMVQTALVLVTLKVVADTRCRYQHQAIGLRVLVEPITLVLNCLWGLFWLVV